MPVTFLGAFFLLNYWLLCGSLTFRESEGEFQADGDPPPTVVSHQLVPAQLSKAAPSYSLSTPLKQAKSKLQIITLGMSHYINSFFKITKCFKSLLLEKKKNPPRWCHVGNFWCGNWVHFLMKWKAECWHCIWDGMIKQK